MAGVVAGVVLGPLDVAGFVTAGPEAAGVRPEPLPETPPGTGGGAETRLPEDDEDDDEEEAVLLEELLEDVAFGCSRFIDDTTDWSVLRAVWAVSLVLVPA